MRFIFACVLSFWSQSGFAASIYGSVKGDDGKPLAFATIYVKQTGTGVVTDNNGNYEITLSPGQYDIFFQFLGYETTAKMVTLGAERLEIHIVLKTQVVELQTVTIRASREDPGYSVMRKAIAKAKYHTQQVDSFSAKVYIKGKVKPVDYPWIVNKRMEKEGIEKGRLFIQESVSEVSYRRPNVFKEKVIAIYTSGKNSSGFPVQLIQGSLYEPEISDVISPLSPKAFSYYKFEYVGSFKDREIEINKIKVTPRSKGDKLYQGTINIVEDIWSIHSADLKTELMGALIQIKQIYNPVEDKNVQAAAWMPVSLQAQFSGAVLGFEFEGQYLTTYKDYKLFLNPALKHEIKVLDEKKVEKPAVVKSATKTQKAEVVQQKLAEGKEVTNKELNQLIKQYEKEEQKKQPEPEVLSDRSFKVDSTARKKDSVFWADMRPAALDPEEVRGYRKADSMAVIEKKREEGDTLKKSKSKKGFQPWDLLTGDSYKLGKTTDFTIHFPYGGFNTVEGFNFVYRMSLYKRWVKRDSLKPELRPKVSRFEITPVLRYSVERNNVIGFLRTDWRNAKTRVTLEGGRYVAQYNPANPIHHFVNTLTSLMWADNLMKIYQRDFTDLTFRHRVGDRFTFLTTWSYSQRSELFNNTSYTLFKKNKDEYTLNAPVNNELNTPTTPGISPTSFPSHQAFTAMARMEFRPFIKYRIRNGNKYRIDGSSPLFAVEYRKGFKGIGGSDVDYDLFDLGIRYGVKLGIRGRLDANVHAGAYLNNNSLYFMDYKHFQGNRTPIITSDPDGSYRLLDYYSNSTADKYLSGIFHYHFRKLLVSRIPKLRLMGVQENMFVAYLGTPASGHYTELGYSIDGILRIFRVEGAASFVNGKYTGYGVRLGIASNITANFGD